MAPVSDTCLSPSRSTMVCGDSPVSYMALKTVVLAILLEISPFFMRASSSIMFSGVMGLSSIDLASAFSRPSSTLPTNEAVLLGSFVPEVTVSK